MLLALGAIGHIARTPGGSPWRLPVLAGTGYLVGLGVGVRVLPSDNVVIAGAFGWAWIGALLLDAGSRAEKKPRCRPRPTMALEMSRRVAADPLEMRVSVQFVNSQVADVLEVLAKAAGLTLEFAEGLSATDYHYLTDVRLRVAFDAICDTASCTWRLDGPMLTLAPPSRLLESSRRRFR